MSEPSTGNDLERRALKAHADAPDALQRIVFAFQSSDVWKVFYAIRHRVKTHDKIVEKVLRKRREGKPTYEPEKVTDIVGIRIVTLFREDVIDAVRLVIDMIRKRPPFQNSPFL